ncbi:hypothetical protein [Rummeliibacillus pycnus]|uniref:hypothetical protein n=1 Tax=Rummeliibacillus pycnus TaxID=101070 RepID=UPI003D29090D
MVKGLLYFIAGIFVIVVAGSVVLENVPSLQPMWKEFQEIASNVYSDAKAKYGITGAVLLIVGVVIMIGTSASGKH